MKNNLKLLDVAKNDRGYEFNIVFETISDGYGEGSVLYVVEANEDLEDFRITFSTDGFYPDDLESDILNLAKKQRTAIVCGAIKVR